jgi:hypothetical protein
MIKEKQEKEIIVDQLKEDNKHLKKMLPLLPPYLPADTSVPLEAIPLAHIPPQQPLQLMATGPSPTPKQHHTKLSFAMIDGMID